MNEQIVDRYLLKCKDYFNESIIPATSIQENNKEYRLIKEISDSIVRNKGIDYFSSLLEESQYLVQLWTAHLILTDKNANDELIKKSLEVIAEYSNNPLTPEVSIEEAKWLKKFYPNSMH